MATLREQLLETETRIINAALNRHNYNITHAALELGLARSTLSNRITKVAKAAKVRRGRPRKK